MKKKNTDEIEDKIIIANCQKQFITFKYYSHILCGRSAGNLHVGGPK